jgi:sulfotransferase
MHGMHKVRPAVGALPRATILPPDLFEQYSNMAFWKNNAGSRANVVTAQPVRETLEHPSAPPRLAGAR